MATQLNWRPDGGIVAHVPENQLPHYDLPPEAVRIQIDGKPAFHVTLIPKHVMLPYAAAMANLWPGISNAVAEPPVAQLSPKLQVGRETEKQKTSWYVEVENADDYRQFVRKLAELIDLTLRTAGYPPFAYDETGHLFHMTIANDQSGNPLYSPSVP